MTERRKMTLVITEQQYKVLQTMAEEEAKSLGMRADCLTAEDYATLLIMRAADRKKSDTDKR